jgi:transposase
MSATATSSVKTPDYEVENQLLREEVASLKHQLDWFKRQLFGQKSEKRHIDPDPDQLGLLGKAEAEHQSPSEQASTVRSYQRGTGKKDRGDAVNDSGLRFDESVEVKDIEIIPDQLRGPDADQYEVIGENKTYRLAQRPSSFFVLCYKELVVKRKTDQQIIHHQSPSGIFDKSIVDVSFLAGMLVDKFVYHLPLYRQHQKLQANGFKLARSSFTNWTKRSIELLEPIYQAQLAHILQSKVLAMDETPIKAGKKGKGKMKTGYFWPMYGDSDEIAFTFSPSRGQQHLFDTLGDTFTGTLLTDGHSAYKKYADKKSAVTHAECWIHNRRNFEEAKDVEPRATEEVLQIIGEIYRHEAIIRQRQLQGEAKLKYRTEHSLPVVEQFFAWCDKQCQREDLLNKNPLSTALNYARKREAELKVFLNDPEVQPDTNHLERALRVIPMGRKSWLFAWTEIGAKHIGIIQSLLVTCRLHDISPYTYLVDVLQRISLHPANQAIDLTPRLWKEKFASNPLKSDIDLLEKMNAH